MRKQDFLVTAADRLPDYHPSQAVLDELGAVDLTSLSGPICMGKDSLIAATGLPRVVTDTIREPRLNGGVLESDGFPYWFRGDDLESVLGDLEAGTYVQANMGPGNDSFYGSRLAAYPSSGPILLDLKTTQAEYMRQLPFARVSTTFITARDFDTWQGRLRKRGVPSVEYMRMRMTEAKQSLEIGLEDEGFIFVLNDRIESAAAVLRGLALTGEYNPRAMIRAKNCAAAILKRLVE